MKFRVLILLLAVLVGISALISQFSSSKKSNNPSLPIAKTTGAELIGGQFSLIDHTGARVTDKDFRGKYLLIFFGFTNCPSICPLGLRTMTQAIEQLGPEGDRVTPIFITVDPERDDALHMASFIKTYGDKLVGLTGSNKEIAEITTAYRAYYTKLKIKDSENYTMDHSSIIYLIDQHGKYLSHFSSELGPEEIAARIHALLNQ